MKLLALLCTLVLTHAEVEKVKPEKVKPEIVADDLKLVQDKDKPRINAHQAQDLQITDIVRNSNDPSQIRKDNIEDVILKELNDLKFSYIRGRSGRGKDAKTEVLNTDETQLKESKLDMPDLEDLKINLIDNKGKGLTVKNVNNVKNEGDQAISEGVDDDIKLNMPYMDEVQNSHTKNKYIKNKHSKHKGVNIKKKVKDDDVSDFRNKVQDTFTANNNMEATVLPEPVSSDVMIRRMKNMKSMKHGIPDLENTHGKKGKKKIVKNTRFESKEFKLNSALVGDAQHDDPKLGIPELEGSGGNDNNVNTAAENKHGKNKDSNIYDLKTNGIETDKQETDKQEAAGNKHGKNKDGNIYDVKTNSIEYDKQEMENIEFNDEKNKEKETRIGNKIIKGNKIINIENINDAKTDDAKTDDAKTDNAKTDDAKTDKLEETVVENDSKKKVEKYKQVKSNSSKIEAPKVTAKKNKTNEIKYNLNLENVRLKDVNLKIPDLVNSNLGHLIGSKSVKVNVSVDVVKLEGMQIRVPESQQANVNVKSDKNESVPEKAELKEHKNSKNEEFNDTDDVKNAEFKAIDDIKPHDENAGIPESEILKFADKNKNVQIKDIQINNFKDLQALQLNASSGTEKRQSKQNKQGKVEKVKFASDEKSEDVKIDTSPPTQKENLGMKHGKDVKIKSIKIKGLNNVKMDDLKGKGANSNNEHTNADVHKQGLKNELDKERDIKIKGIRIKGINGIRIKDVKLEDMDLPVAGEKGSKEGDKKKTVQFKVIKIEGDDENANNDKLMKEGLLQHLKIRHDSNNKEMSSNNDKDVKADLNVGNADAGTHYKARDDNNNKSEKTEVDEGESHTKFRDEKHNPQKMSDNKDAKTDDTKGIQNQDGGKNAVKFNEDNDAEKEDFNVKGVSRLKSRDNKDDFKLDEDKDAKSDDSDMEDDKHIKTRHDKDKTFKLDEDKQVSSEAEDPNIEGITRLESDDDNSKGFKLNEDYDKTDDPNGEGTSLFRENNDSMERGNTDDAKLETKRGLVPTGKKSKRLVINHFTMQIKDADKDAPSRPIGDQNLRLRLSSWGHKKHS